MVSDGSTEGGWFVGWVLWVGNEGFACVGVRAFGFVARTKEATMATAS